MTPKYSLSDALGSVLRGFLALGQLFFFSSTHIVTAKSGLYQHVPQMNGKGNFNMSRLDDIIADCEKNAVSDDKIDYSEIPEIMDFSDFHFANDKSPEDYLRCLFE